MFYNVLLPLFESLAGLAGLVGLLMIGSKALHRRRPTTISIKLVVAALIFFSLLRFLLPKPDQQDLVGHYHLSQVTVADFDQSKIKSYSLSFLPNGKYKITPISDLELGDTGTYTVDYNSSLNEVHFKYKYEFGSGGFTAHIDRRLGTYHIEFMVGDPDLGESYYFEKDSKRCLK